MDEHERNQVIASADRFANGNPPPFFCPTCCNTGRKWESRDNMFCYLEDILEKVKDRDDHEANVRTLERAVQVMIEWDDDHCIPCPDC